MKIIMKEDAKLVSLKSPRDFVGEQGNIVNIVRKSEMI